MIDCLSIFESRFKKPIPIPKIVIRPRAGLKGGSANVFSNRIMINEDACKLDWEYIINQTLPHEVCHIVASYINPNDRGHGYTWKNCMRILGLTPNRCMTSKLITRDNLKTRERKVRRDYAYKCDCENYHFLTSVLHNRILRGSIRRCVKCGQQIKYVGMKMP